jgi:hypothetical protein
MSRARPRGRIRPPVNRQDTVEQRPKARTEGVVAERVGDELVVYDQQSQVGHCLSSTAASVWERCDGALLPAEIAAALTLEQTAVERAADELRECGLLDDGPVAETGYSRREAAVKFARVGGGALMAPLIYSVAIPQAAAAASACITNGNSETLSCSAAVGAKAADARCCSGTCYQTGAHNKICVAPTCNLAGIGCIGSGATCCSGSCFLLFCQA